MSIRKWIIIAVFLAAPMVIARPTADSQWKAILPDAAFETLVTSEASLLNGNLEKGLDKRTTARSRTSAMMIAGYAQSCMMAGDAKAGQMATLRDQALKTSEAIGKGKLDDAKNLAAGLSPTIKADAGAKTEPVNLNKNLELEELMHQFKPERAGGKELEKKIKAYMQKKAPLTSDEIKDAAKTAYQTAIIAQFTVGFAPKTDSGKKTKADWMAWSNEMGELAVSAAKTASASKPDDKAVKTAMRKLDDVCTKCHNVFKEN